MKKKKSGLLRSIATRTVIAAIPVAMVSAYAGGVSVVPRSASYDIQTVAEIKVSNSTVGVADSSLYFLSPTDINKQLDQLQALGVQNVRVFVPWAFVEPVKDSYDWSIMNTIMQAAAARNMGVLAEINSTPAWTAPAGTLPGAGQPEIAQFSQFVRDFATKYGQTVSAYEIWNEPNYVAFHQPISPEAYTELLKAAYPELKQIDPTATVVAAGLGAVQSFGNFTLNPVEYVQRMYQAGAAKFFDALAFHPYQESLPFSQGVTNGLSPLAQLQAIKSLMDLYDSAPGTTQSAKLVWVTEYGLPTSNVTQTQQAAYIKDFLQKWSTLAWAGPAFIYTTRDQYAPGTPSASLPDYNYGLYNYDGTPKLAADIIKQWIASHPGQTVPPVVVPPVVTPPVDPIAQFFAALAQQLAQAIAQAVANWAAQMAAQMAAQAATPVATAAPQVQARTLAAVTQSVDETGTETAAPAATDGAPVKEATASDGATPPASTAPTTPATDTAGITPVAADVEVTKPAAVEPEATTPVASEPAATKPEAAEPAATKPADTKPADTKPADTKPADTKPADTKPADTKPAATKPADTKPAATKPADTKSAATKPADTKPADTKPAKAPASEKPAKADRGADGTTSRHATRRGAGQADGAKPAAAAVGASVSGAGE